MSGKWVGNVAAVGIGLAVSLAGLVGVQWLLGRSDYQQRSKVQRDESSQAFYETNHPVLGWKLLPNVESHVVRYFGDDRAYDYVLRTDQFGRRIIKPPKVVGEGIAGAGGSSAVGADGRGAAGGDGRGAAGPGAASGGRTDGNGPAGAAEARGAPPPEQFLIWLGGSFMAGEGLPDPQTLDFQVSAKLPQFQTYNYGVFGYGLAHVLAQVDNVDFSQQVAQRSGVVVYLFPSFHIDRMVGGLQSIDWIGPIPYYQWRGDQLVRDGFLQDKQPLRTWAKKFLNKSFLRRKYQISWPFEIAEADIQLACRALAEVRDRMASRFGQGPSVPATTARAQSGNIQSGETHSDETQSGETSRDKTARDETTRGETARGLLRFLLVLHPLQSDVDVTPCLAKYQIEYLDLRSALDSVPSDQRAIPLDGHPSGETNRVIAERIAAFLGGGNP